MNRLKVGVQGDGGTARYERNDMHGILTRIIKGTQTLCKLSITGSGGRDVSGQSMRTV